MRRVCADLGMPMYRLSADCLIPGAVARVRGRLGRIAMRRYKAVLVRLRTSGCDDREGTSERFEVSAMGFNPLRAGRAFQFQTPNTEFCLLLC